MADNPPQEAETVAIPGDWAVTTPADETVATYESDVDHSTKVSVASAGNTVALRWLSSPILSFSSVLLIDIDDTGTSLFLEQAAVMTVIIADKTKILFIFVQSVFRA